MCSMTKKGVSKQAIVELTVKLTQKMGVSYSILTVLFSIRMEELKKTTCRHTRTSDRPKIIPQTDLPSTYANSGLQSYARHTYQLT
jgi:hypothetical protein